MIDKEVFSDKWINILMKKYKITDKNILQKYLHALFLLELLALKTNYVLKGGTAVTLLSKRPSRFSIDVDIMLNKDSLKKVLETIKINSNIFFDYEEIKRKQQYDIPKEHYKIYYKNIDGKIDNILLDILKEDVPYHNVKKIEIMSDFIKRKGKKIFVNVPSCEDLLGDKLTAFAPNTTGIPYYKENRDRGMEINKQLFDIGYLFECANNMNTVRNTFFRILEKEISYRKSKNLSIEDIIDDIFNTSLLILNTKEKSKEKEILFTGRKKLNAYIWDKQYTQERFLINASKVSYLIMLIKYEKNMIEKFTANVYVPEIKGKYKHFNKLKKISPESFFYLYKAFKLLGIET